MRILLTTYQGGLAGSTHSIAFLAEGLANRGHQVYLAGKKDTRLFEKLKNTAVHLVPMRFKSKLDMQTVKAIKELVEAEKIEVINAQSSKDRYLAIFAKWKYKLDVKLVHTRRQRPESIGGWLQNSFYIKGTDKIVVVSDELKNIFIQKGFPAEHLHVIYNGTPAEQYQNIDEQRVQELRNELALSSNDTVIGCVARMKEQDQLVKALPHLDENIKVVFAGIPEGSLDHYIKRYKVKQKVIYAGKLSHRDTLHLYKLLNVNVLPSTMDGFGLVLVEAMAMGTPVVATRSGGIVDVVDDGINGLLFENNNIPDLSKKIKTVLFDDEVRQSFIKNGKVTAFEKFSLDKTIDNYEKFFYELLESPTLKN
ncbi:glycosyltransferase family 4 protein [Porifericola rhodea]|uniref:glycosyltransferase family 4 protein n=1 Tax=Porifericola rhodea TaxID=930972 RepID=UPI002664EA5D|nr:glycosyltransferase family 4 protein [Porifericola rhodea]WKN32040.1 glycosyltransferase family 4 protein [Porifericola rhodea]